MLEKEIADYLINDTQNGFSGTKVVNFNNGVPDREKQIQIKNDVLSKLTGSYGEKVIIAFNNNAESKTTVDDIPLNDAPSHYQYLSEECQRKILVTHRVTSPLLIGLGSANGFSSNADEIRNATLLFDNIVIKPYQHLIIDALDEILAYNNITLNLYFKTLEPLEFMELDDVVSEEQREEETGVKADEEQAELEMSTHKHCLSDMPDEVYDGVLSVLHGEVMDSDEYEMVDIRDVDEENESVEDWAKDMIKLSIDSKEDGFSYLDASYYKVRYKYVKGSRRPNKSGNKSRKFCEEMMSRTRQGIVYRIEDIDKASREMNFKAAELPMHKGKKYDLFRFKGGVYCKHKWQEVLYKVKKLDDKGSKDLGDYKTIKKAAFPKSYKKNPVGSKQSVKAPINMPNNGHHPNYKK